MDPMIPTAAEQDSWAAGGSEVDGVFAVVDLMGHVRVAGKLSEVLIAGQAFLRINVPEVLGKEIVPEEEMEAADLPTTGVVGFRMRCLFPAVTYYQSAASIYGITPVTEAVARRLAATFRKDPARPWDFAEADEAIARKVRDNPTGEAPMSLRPRHHEDDRDNDDPDFDRTQIEDVHF